MSLVKQISVCEGKDNQGIPVWNTKDIGVDVNNINFSDNKINNDDINISYTENDYLLYIKNGKLRKSNITLQQIQDLIFSLEEKESSEEPEL